MRSITIELDRPRRLRYDFNALADLEDKAGVGMGSLVSGSRMGFNTIRLLLWAGLKWEDKSLTVAGVGDILQGYLEGNGSLETVSKFIETAMMTSGILGKEGNAGTEAAK